MDRLGREAIRAWQEIDRHHAQANPGLPQIMIDLADAYAYYQSMPFLTPHQAKIFQEIQQILKKPLGGAAK
jgi:hypothetical protein